MRIKQTTDAPGAFSARAVNNDDIKGTVATLRLQVREPSGRNTKEIVIDRQWNETHYGVAVIPQPEESEAISTAQEPPKRSVKRNFTVAGSGICIGILVAVGLLYNFRGDAMVQEFTGAAPLAVEQSVPVDAAVVPVSDLAEAPVSAPIVEEVSMTEIIPAESGAIEHATNGTVIPQGRQFEYLSGSERAYAPVYLPPQESGITLGQNGKVALRDIPDRPGRLADQGSEFEWQNGFTLNNPEKNIELGTAYQQYLGETFGSEMSPKLLGIDHGASGLLRNVTTKSISSAVKP